MEPVDRSTIWPYDEHGEPGQFYYSRYDSPTVAEAEARLGELDGGHALLFPSGSGATTALVLSLLGAVICRDPAAADALRTFRTRTGIVAAADPAWLLLRGLKTLDVRVSRQAATAAALAERLRSHPKVRAVRYAGIGGLLSFDL